MRRLLAAVGMCAVAAAGFADGPPTPALTAEQLVARLGADRFADREAAARALEAAGPAVIPALRAAAGHPDPEVRRRAAALLAKLQRSADSARWLAPAKMVALNYDRVPLGTAVNDLKARTGVNLTLDPAKVADPLRPVTVQTGELPPWQAIDAFCKAAGLREEFRAELELPRPDRRGRGYYTPPPPPPQAAAVPVVLADGRGQDLPGDRSTAVRVLALPASFPGNRVTVGTGEVTLNFDVTPLPGLNWRDAAGVRVTRVVDDSGRPGTGGTPRETGAQAGLFLDGPAFANPVVVMRWDLDGNPVPPGWYANPRVVPVPLHVATPGARSLRLLEGFVLGEVVLPNQPLLTADDLGKTDGATVEGPNGLRLTVLGVKESGAGGGPVVVRAQLTAPSPLAANRRAFLNPWGPVWPDSPRPVGGFQVHALDAAGKQLAAAFAQSTDITEDGMTMTQQFQLTCRADRGGAPAKLVVVGPRAVTVVVPFRMENVPLP